MPEHVHLLLSEPQNARLSLAIQILKQRLSLEMRTNNSSHNSFCDTQPCSEALRFWQRRYHDFNVFSEMKYKGSMQYMHENPVKRGLVQNALDWPWSSFATYARGDPGLIHLDPPRCGE